MYCELKFKKKLKKHTWFNWSGQFEFSGGRFISSMFNSKQRHCESEKFQNEVMTPRRKARNPPDANLIMCSIKKSLVPHPSADPRNLQMGVIKRGTISFAGRYYIRGWLTSTYPRKTKIADDPSEWTSQSSYNATSDP